MYRAFDIDKIESFLMGEFARKGEGVVELFDTDMHYGTLALNKVAAGYPIRIADKMFLHYDYDRGDNKRSNDTAKMIAGLVLRIHKRKIKTMFKRRFALWS